VKEPLIKVALPSDSIVKQICQRAILIKFVCELVGEGETIEELSAGQANQIMAPFAGKRFKIRVDTVDRKMKPKEKV